MEPKETLPDVGLHKRVSRRSSQGEPPEATQRFYQVGKGTGSLVRAGPLGLSWGKKRGKNRIGGGKETCLSMKKRKVRKDEPGNFNDGGGGMSLLGKVGGSAGGKTGPTGHGKVASAKKKF